MLEWREIAAWFHPDGNSRDIYVLDTSFADWQSLLEALRQSRFDLGYCRAGAKAPLPANAAEAFPDPGMADRVLSVNLDGAAAYCHFFTESEIEFDIDPREVVGQLQLDAILDFMRVLSNSTGKESILTPENCPHIVIVSVPPGDAAPQYRSFGRWN